MCEKHRQRSILPHLDRFQIMKRGRMMCLLEELEKMGEVPVLEFLSYIAVKYGIRRTTGLEYLEDWSDGGYISLERDIIRFLKKPEK